MLPRTCVTPHMMGPRQRTPERLDQPGHDPGSLAQTLLHMEQVNRWLGGERALRSALREFRQPGTPLRVLDLGTGNGSVPASIRAWAARGGADWFFVGVDRHPQIAALAGRRRRADAGLTVVRADGVGLPFADRSFDVAVATLTLHHFDDRQAVLVLEEMRRVARSAVIVNDLERRWLHYASAKLLSVTLWRTNPLTRHDGPASVRSSFTRSELRRLGEMAGLRGVRVVRRFPFRLVLTGRPAGARDRSPSDRLPVRSPG